MTLGSSTLDKHQWNFASEFDYGYHLLELTRNGRRAQGIVDHLFIQHFSASFAPTNNIQFDCDIPVVWYEGLGGGGGSVTSVGEVLLRSRFRLLDSKKYFVGLALVPFGTIPTGEANHYLSDHGPTLGVLVAVDKDLNSKISVGFNFGADGRGHVTFRDLRSGSRFWFSGGVRIKVGPSFTFKGDVTAHSPFSNLFENKVASPVELLTDVDYQIKNTPWRVNLGWGLSIVRAAGEPIFRSLAGVAYLFKE